MLNERNYYTLKLLLTFKKVPQKTFLQNIQKISSGFFVCLRNLVEGNIPGIRQKQVTHFKAIIKRELLKKSSLQERRVQFSSTKRLSVFNNIGFSLVKKFRSKFEINGKQ